MKIKQNIFFLCLMPFVLISCGSGATKETKMHTLIPVKTTRLKPGSIQKQTYLNGVTRYLKKSTIVAPASAYVKKVNVQYGKKIAKNELLYELQTKEGMALNNAIGKIKVNAFSPGTVVDIAINQPGNFVTEGAPLCTLVAEKDVVIQLNVPFAFNKLVKEGTKYPVLLPDSSTIQAVVTQILPSVNAVDQTQTVFLKPIQTRPLPENLNVLIKFVLAKKDSAILLDKQAVLANEEQTRFWVMKIVNDSLALQVSITKGIENDSLVEVLNGNVNQNDLIISEGAYGLPDSTLVKVVK